MSPLKIGDNFPVIEVQTLEDKLVNIPEDCKGKFTILATGFSMQAQLPINSWTDFVLTEHPDWNYYEVPIGSEWYKPMAKSIDNAMKREVPKSLHSKTATYYGKKCKDYKRLFNVKDESTCYVFLLDTNGKILYKAVGSITKEILNEIRTCL